ncbi:Cytoskeletal-regulatory complex EF hand-containing protein [Elsinoe fawcettii]|nr:Cytoskeletal-regulatory complex EF hand-containing protein [Elsinoe fawcettii]
MTSPRQRLGRPSPPHVSNEAALVGALTAFAKSPSSSTSPGQRGSGQGQTIARPNVRTHTISLKPPAPEENQHVRQPQSSTGSRRPIRHDSGASPLTKEQDAEANQKLKSSEASPPRPKVQKKPKPLALSGTQVSPVAKLAPMQSIDSAIQRDGPDDERIPSTSALVQIFEKQGTRTVSADLHTPLKSPKPMRKSLVLDQDDQTVSSHIKPRQPSDASDVSSAEKPPLSGRSRTTDISSPNSFRSARDSFSPLVERKDSTVEKPLLPPPRRASKLQPPPLDTKPTISPASDVPRTAPIPIKSSESSPYAQPALASSSASIQATYNSLHPRRTHALRTGDSLANAIVASSLASSRAPSPAKVAPLSSSQRSSYSHHHIFTRTPSPHKRKPASANAGGMRHTLRKETPSSADEGNLEDDPYYKHKKKRHIRKHANKYHEGDRKRWRNVVTERERDRYEGVWAANRGLLFTTGARLPITRRTATKPRKQGFGVAGSWMDDTGVEMDGSGTTPIPEEVTDDTDKNYVHAFVVRDIWSRSRLPMHVLEEIWNLVDSEDRGALCKEEFVVGMWLVDQRLKGRKLPVKVSDSVWDSVRFLKGLKIRPAKDRMAKVKK